MKPAGLHFFCVVFHIALQPDALWCALQHQFRGRRACSKQEPCLGEKNPGLYSPYSYSEQFVSIKHKTFLKAFDFTFHNTQSFVKKKKMKKLLNAVSVPEMWAMALMISSNTTQEKKLIRLSIEIREKMISKSKWLTYVTFARNVINRSIFSTIITQYSFINALVFSGKL